MTGYKTNGVILDVKNVSLSYGKKEILSNVNFQIKDIVKDDNPEQGQIVSLVGRSGIGKTQLFRLLSGLNKQTSGEILMGAELQPVKPGQVGVVTQSYNLFEHRTVKKNLLMSGAPWALVEEYCKEFDLLQHIDKYPMQLSGGQRQRTSILQQVLRGNKFILLDEPFSGLDPIMVKKTVALLLKVSKINDNTLIIVSHDLVNSAAISDTIFLMTKPDLDKGANLSFKYDLLQLGLAWEPEIKKNPKFWEVIEDIENKM